MTKIKNYIGIDISKTWFDVAIISPQLQAPLQARFDNTIVELKKFKSVILSKGITLNKSTLVVCEHSGIYKKLIVDFLLKQKSLLCIESAQRIKKSLGIQRGKNDSIDAVRIAEYGAKNGGNLVMWENPRKIVSKLKDLLVNRERILKAISSLSKPINETKIFYSKVDFSHFKKINKKAMDGLNESLVDIENEIQNIKTQDSKIKRLTDLLTSVPGIGPITALYLICYTHEFTICKGAKQLACYVGIAPFEFTSGSGVRGRTRVSHIANKKLKALLYMGALNLTKTKGELRDYYERKVAEGKNKMSVINALKNKMIHRAFAVIQRGTPYIKQKSSCPSSNPNAVDS